ncbi:hypothetical protein D3C83_135120 [compost metagenome]
MSGGSTALDSAAMHHGRPPNEIYKDFPLLLNWVCFSPPSGTAAPLNASNPGPARPTLLTSEELP